MTSGQLILFLLLLFDLSIRMQRSSTRLLRPNNLARPFSSSVSPRISSSSALSFPRTKPSTATSLEGTEQEELQVPNDILSYKIQSESTELAFPFTLQNSLNFALLLPDAAIPFQLPPSRALDISYTAAASTFGVNVVFTHLLSRFFKKWFGLSLPFLDSGIVERAFKMVLLPVWKVDLVMRGKALLQDTELDLNSKFS